MQSLNVTVGEEDYLTGPRRKERLGTKSIAFLVVLVLTVAALAVRGTIHEQSEVKLSTSERAQVLDEPMVTVMGSDTLNKAYNFFRGEGANAGIARSLGRFTTDEGKKIEYGGTVYLQPDQVDVTMNSQCWGVQQGLAAFATYSVRQAASFAAEATFQLTSTEVGQALAMFSGWGLPRGPNPGTPPPPPNSGPNPNPRPNPNPNQTPIPTPFADVHTSTTFRGTHSTSGRPGPVGTTPRGTTPRGTTPRGTTPRGTTPRGTGPPVSKPPGTSNSPRPPSGTGSPIRPTRSGPPIGGPIGGSIAGGSTLALFFGGSFGMTASQSYAGLGLTKASNSFMQSSLFETFVDWERRNSKFQYQPEFKRLVKQINCCAHRWRRRRRFSRRQCRRLVLRMFDRFGTHVIQDATYGARCTMTTFMDSRASSRSVSVFLEAAAAAGLSSSVFVSASGWGATGPGKPGVVSGSTAKSTSVAGTAAFKATGAFAGTFGAGYKYQIGNVRCEGVVRDNLCDKRLSGKEENPVMINYAPFPIWKVQGAGWNWKGRRNVELVVRDILSSFVRCSIKNCGGKGVCVSNPLFWDRVSSRRFSGRLTGLWRNRCMKY